MYKDISFDNFTPNNRTKSIRMQVVTASKKRKEKKNNKIPGLKETEDDEYKIQLNFLRS